MRKKSHISLAGYLIGELESEQLDRHKKAFYFGSILPDLTPKMFAVPHEFQTSYRELQEKVLGLIAYVQTGEGKERVVWRRLGVVMHYLADYFTFPHNTVFDGNLKDHCLYEACDACLYPYGGCEKHFSGTADAQGADHRCCTAL